MSSLAILRSIIVARGCGLLRLRPAKYPLSLDCLGDKCGLCCQVFGGCVTLVDDEADKLVQIGAAVPNTRGAIVLKSRKTCCSHLSNNVCSIYESRPRSCHEYPWYSIKGHLYYDSGCPGIKKHIEGRPDPVTLIRFEKYIDDLPQLLKILVSFVLRIW